MAQPYSFYSDVEDSVLNRQMLEENQRQKGVEFERQQALKEMQAPAEIAASNLARMTAEKDQRLMPMQEEVATQNLDAEKKFNTIRQMRALMDEEGINEDHRKELLRNGLLKTMGVRGTPTLENAREVARAEYLLKAYEQNPDQAKAQLDNAMSSYARNFKSTQQQDLAQTRGHLTNQGILLRTSAAEQLARLKSGLGSQNPKTYEALKTADVVALRRAGRNDEADAMEQALGMWKSERAELERDKTGSRYVATPGSGQIDIKPQPVTPAPRVPVGSKAGGSVGDKKSFVSITVGGKTFDKATPLGDGRYEVTLPDGTVRIAKVK